MTMGSFNNLDEDKMPIINSFRRLGIGLREIAVMCVVIVLVVICIVLAILLSVEKGKLKDENSLPTFEALTGKNGPLCLSPPCLKIAVHALENMKTSADPCDDFYEYACLNFERTHKVDSTNGLHSTLTDLHKGNKRKVENLLLKPIERNSEPSSERKMKEFYQSCMDDLARERRKGKPFIEIIIPKLNGWYVFGDWKEEKFDLNQVLKTVQADLFTSALFHIYPGFGDNDKPKRIIEIHGGGYSYNLPLFSYLNVTNSREGNDYKIFMRRIAKLLLRDADIKVTPNVTDRIEQFVNDVIQIESKIVEAHFDVMTDLFDSGQIMSIAELTRQTGPLIDWVVQIGGIFNQLGVSKDTAVYVDNIDYLKGVVKYIRSLDPKEMPRILHNYFTWRVLEHAVTGLSSEYELADREIYSDLNGVSQFQPRSEICFGITTEYFSEAMGALYIADHYLETNKKHIVDITSSIKESFSQFISNNEWMDAATKTIATDKVSDITFLIGYPEFITDHALLDKRYAEFNINSSSYFENMVNLFADERRQWNDFMLSSTDPTRWYFDVFSANAGYFFLLNQVTFPAGLMQFPLYNYDMPHYVTFGSVGALLGRSVLFAIDSRGRQFDKHGNKIADKNGFWTEASANAFNETVYQCMAESASDVTQGPFTTAFVEDETVPISDQITNAIIRNAAGVRFTFDAYLDWKKQGKVKELRPLPTMLSDEQMFFVSYAQMFCETYNDARGYEMALTDGVKNVRINLELKHLEEFSHAFKCPSGSKMNPEKKCPLY